MKRASKPAITPEKFLAAQSSETQEIANAIRAFIKQTIPDVIERVYVGWGVLGYRVKREKHEAYFAYINPHEDFATIGFEWGAALDDLDGMLENENLKQVRFITFRSVEAISEMDSKLRALILQAADVALLPHELRALLLRSQHTNDKIVYHLR
jgi:hypothetical protein